MSENELLREALMDLERARARENRARVESETVLAALAVITSSTTTEVLFQELIPVLKPLLNFETAVVAAPMENELSILWSSDANERDRRFDIASALNRSVQAGALYFFDIRRAPELAELRRFGTSLLMAPMHMMNGVGALLLFNPKRGAFDESEHTVLKRLGPLLAQTMAAIQARERKAEAELQGLARFPQENPRPVFRSDFEGNVLYANPPAKRLLNLSESQEERVPETWMPLIRSARHSATTIETEVHIRGRVFHASISPFLASGYINLYFTDISERVHAARDLIRSNSRMETLFSASPAGILLEDENRHIVLVNQALCTMFRVPLAPEEMVGGDCAVMAQTLKLHFADPSLFLQDVKEALEQRFRRTAELVELADGRFFERSYTPILLGAESGGHLWQYTDVTERQAGDEALKKAVASAETANAAKSEFLARMSHEIRTPLNAVLGMSELLLDTPLEDSQQAWLRGINANANALLYLINDVLDMSRIEAGEVSLNHLPVDPRALAEEIAQSFASRAAGQGISLICTIDPSVPSRIVGDPVRLRQILANLVANAVKYTDDGGVEIKLSQRLLQGRNALKMEVRDSGMGVPLHEQERIFQKYAQVEEGVRGGTGLGLHITRNLVELMGGKLTLSSALGKGSSFTAVVPIQVSEYHNKAEQILLEATRLLRPLLVVGDAPYEIRHIQSILGQSLPCWRLNETAPNLDRAGLLLIEDSASNEQVRWALESGLPLVHIAPSTGGRHKLPPMERCKRVFRPVQWQRLRTAMLRSCMQELPQSSNPSGPQVESTRLRVLVVDDNADNRAVARGLLEAGGHSVVLAKNGTDGIVLAGQERFDLILMDLHMPGMDGLTASSAIWRNEARMGQDETHILAFTADATVEVRDRALSLGLLGFVTKPVQREQLLESMQRTVGRPGRTLVVDDSPDIQRLVTHYIRTAGHRVFSACTGEECLETVANYPVSLVLMDIEMPGMGGVKALEQLRAQGFGKPVIALTGHTEPALHQELLAVGFDQVLTKPVRRDTVWKALREWFPPVPWVSERHIVEVDLDLKDLIKPFLNDRSDDVLLLRTALESKDLQAIKRVGHSMKGNGSSYGFHEVSRLGDQIERQARDGASDKLRKSTDELEEYLSKITVTFTD
ncbi:MAG: signal transduction histidine kinase/DNA-binding response OmpR family regulator [Cognaticolwellia sp.]|jgi:signal transduction histidine kinase/DNA-binding response OmpR family regulator/HPt (histidine-containing phosphotransfer) domain-containing protein